MPNDLDPADRKMLDIIERHGWLVLKIAPDKGSEDDRAFAFTIGLSTTFGWPELICIGLDRGKMGKLLNAAVEAIRRTGHPPKTGDLLHGAAEGYAMKLVRFPEQQFPSHLGTAIWYAAHVGLPFDRLTCLQLTWPDRNGKFPGDPDCIAEVAELQRPIED